MKSITDYNVIFCACGGNLIVDESLSEMDAKQMIHNFAIKHKNCLQILAKAEGREIIKSEENLLFDLP